LAFSESRALLAPKDLTHESLEFIVSDLAWGGDLNLLKHLLELFVGEMLAFSAEALVQVIFCDKARVIDVEVMEGKGHVGFSEGSSTVDSDSKELSVVDLTIVVEIDAIEDLSNFCLRHVEPVESSFDLGKSQGS
jgi:hypothetical protein